MVDRKKVPLESSRTTRPARPARPLTPVPRPPAAAAPVELGAGVPTSRQVKAMTTFVNREARTERWHGPVRARCGEEISPV